MNAWNTFAAELRKTATLPAAWAGVAVALLGSVAITLLNAFSTRAALDAGQPETRAFTSPFETAFAAMPLGTVGAVVIGVIVFSSEYMANSTDAGGGRQITAALTASPRRVGLLAAKAATIVVFVAVVAVVTLPITVGIARAVIGEAGTETVTLDEAVTRCLGGTLYWALTGLIAFAITVLTRSGIIPLIVLIVNSSVVSFSLLLTNLTPLAHWLPDMAGRRLFGGLYTIEGGLDAVPGALVMGGWTLALLIVATVVFRRRDA
ncbi:ABC-2 family transporter protein [Micromonospora pallida]|uniref:ABC-2 family transporter protein n=1 Tax=Micromonospora pallida TaxID=145854 RepID=A0A1C6SKC7_9ACTN|nr:ABC transporter permease [Micromonospora pallida]SCL29877.1 ABC-2 family transporter protein [Micromonospora pallida]